MSWSLAVLLTNADNGKPVVGSPLTAAEVPVRGPATPAVITDASGRATLIYNGDLYDFGNLDISVLEPSTSTAAVYTTWSMALTVKNDGKPRSDVRVYFWPGPDEPQAITNDGGWAGVKFKVYAVPGLPLQIVARVGRRSGIGSTLTVTPDETAFAVGGVTAGTDIITYA